MWLCDYAIDQRRGELLIVWQARLFSTHCQLVMPILVKSNQKYWPAQAVETAALPIFQRIMLDIFWRILFYQSLDASLDMPLFACSTTESWNQIFVRCLQWLCYAIRDAIFNLTCRNSNACLLQTVISDNDKILPAKILFETFLFAQTEELILWIKLNLQRFFNELQITKIFE